MIRFEFISFSFFTIYIKLILANRELVLECPIQHSLAHTLNNNSVSYYEKLIRDEIQKATSYTPPTNNYYFLNGSNSSETQTDFGEYDFIIVGAGTSGSILAYKLTQNKNFSVLLLEAGGNETDFSVIPYYAPYVVNSTMNWGYYTVPQEHVCNDNYNKKCKYHRGKAMGGTGAINAMQYVRGNKEDYNSWSAAGNKGWSYEELLPYFIELEDTLGYGDPGYRGQKGLLQVSLPNPISPLMRNFLDGNKQMGRDIVDYNGEKQLGASVLQFNIGYGERESGGRVFVSRVECMKIFKIVEEALVTKIVIDGESLIASGVEFTKKGCNYSVKAKKGVILSAGSINTPQLLMLSGVGKRDDLKKLGIDVKLDLHEVGRNFQDHVVHSGLRFSTNFSTKTVDLEKSIRMYLDGFGPLTLPLNGEGISFYRIKNSLLPQGVPDIQIVFSTPARLQEDSAKYNYITIFPVLLHPKTEGLITLISSSPFEFPKINISFLENEEDRQVFYDGIEAVFDLMETKAFKKINATFIKPNISECDQYEFRSKDYWICNLKYNGNALWHATSTAAMGRVVDEKLKVKGIGNLRIVDCSIMPNITSGNTNVPAFVIGAKAADLIKYDYN